MQDLISEDNDISGMVFQTGVKGSLGISNTLADHIQLVDKYMYSRNLLNEEF